LIDGKALVRGHHPLQKWNQWLSQDDLGSSVVDEERRLLQPLLSRHYGKHALLIGVPRQKELLRATDMLCQSILSPLTAREDNHRFIESDFQELPIFSGSIDLVVLPHTLEYVDNPQHLLAEACRIVKPDGLIAVFGFNPYSAWGAMKFAGAGNFIHARKVKNWLRLSDFVLEQQKAALFRPPLRHKSLFNKLHFIEGVGNKCLPFLSGAYLLLARATVMPLTPIKMKWKQQLTGIRISTSISGHIARQSK
jgi:SAM-dependent methyltransferase